MRTALCRRRGGGIVVSVSNDAAASLCEHSRTEDLLPALDVGQGHIDVAIESARPRKRVVEDTGEVGRPDDDDAIVLFKSIHIHQEQCLDLDELYKSQDQTLPDLFLLAQNT